MSKKKIKSSTAALQEMINSGCFSYETNSNYLYRAILALREINADPNLTEPERLKTQHLIVIGIAITMMAIMKTFAWWGDMSEDPRTADPYEIHFDELRKKVGKYKTRSEFYLEVGKQALITHELPFNFSKLKESGFVRKFVLANMSEEVLQTYCPVSSKRKISLYNFFARFRCTDEPRNYGANNELGNTGQKM